MSGSTSSIAAGKAGSTSSIASDRSGSTSSKASEEATLHTNAPAQFTHTVDMVVRYNGSQFHGFARQPETLTVQGSIEDALHVIYKRPVETTCAGRTDAGVHALGQHVSFEITHSETIPEKLQPSRLKQSVNALVAEGISVEHVNLINGKFSARHDAKCRHYSYYICAQPTPPIVMKDFCWHVPNKLDTKKMQEAANNLIGEHDFKSFCVAASSKKLDHTFRCLNNIAIEVIEICGDNIIKVDVSGNAFLHSMVRTIVGTLYKVGAGHREPDWVKEVLEGKDRQLAGECAPACGLFFAKVDY